MILHVLSEQWNLLEDFLYLFIYEPEVSYSWVLYVLLVHAQGNLLPVWHFLFTIIHHLVLVMVSISSYSWAKCKILLQPVNWNQRLIFISFNVTVRCKAWLKNWFLFWGQQQISSGTKISFFIFQDAAFSYMVICILTVNKTGQIERLFTAASNWSVILWRWVSTVMESSVYASHG